MNNEKLIGYILSDVSTGRMEIKPKILSRTDKSITFETILQEGNKVNRNNRVYPTNIIEEGLKAKHITEQVVTNNWAGESDHPFDQDKRRQMRIELNNISHYVKKWWRDGDLIKGVCSTSCTPVGIALMNDITENNLIPAFSLRCLARYDNVGGRTMIKGPIHVICYDRVMYPSHAKAYGANTLSENANLLTVKDLELLNKEDSTLLESIGILGFDVESDTFVTNENYNIVARSKTSTAILTPGNTLKKSLSYLFK